METVKKKIHPLQTNIHVNNNIHKYYIQRLSGSPISHFTTLFVHMAALIAPPSTKQNFSVQLKTAGALKFDHYMALFSQLYNHKFFLVKGKKLDVWNYNIHI